MKATPENSFPAASPHHEAHAAGGPPFLEEGSVVLWRYRGWAWREGAPEDVAPMRVVRDDERGLVAWMPAGVVKKVSRLVSGEELRSVPLAQRWTEGTHQRAEAIVPWRGNGVLRIAPAGVPWSVWLFWSPGDGDNAPEWCFEGWYVNLESPHLREGASTVSSDHVLDVLISADGAVQMKDEDELEAATQQGRFTEQQAALIRIHAAEAIQAFQDGHWAFDRAWSEWRPGEGDLPPRLPGSEFPGASIALKALDPMTDREEIVSFLTANSFPFHLGAALSEEEALDRIDTGRLGPKDHAAWWIEYVEERVGILVVEDIADEGVMIDIRLAERVRGRAIGTAVAGAIPDLVFSRYPHVTRIEAQTRDDNVAMRRALLRAGWVKEAYYRDGWPDAAGTPRASIAYGVTRRDWESGETTVVPWHDEP